MRGMRATLCFWLMTVSMALAEPAPSREQVRQWLSFGVEGSPALTRLGGSDESLSQTLMAIYADKREARYVRLRALAALGRREDRAAAQFLLRLVHLSTLTDKADADALHPARSSLVLRRAIDGLAPRKLPAAEADLTLCLRHPNPGVRASAVLALRAYGKASIEQNLTIHLAQETSARIRLLITDRSALPTDLRSNAPESAPPPR